MYTRYKIQKIHKKWCNVAPSIALHKWVRGLTRRSLPPYTFYFYKYAASTIFNVIFLRDRWFRMFCGSYLTENRRNARKKEAVTPLETDLTSFQQIHRARCQNHVDPLPNPLLETLSPLFAHFGVSSFADVNVSSGIFPLLSILYYITSRSFFYGFCWPSTAFISPLGNYAFALLWL